MASTNGIHFLGKTTDGKVFRVSSRDAIPVNAKRRSDKGTIPGTRRQFSYDVADVIVLHGTASDVRKRAKGFLSAI